MDNFDHLWLVVSCHLTIQECFSVVNIVLAGIRSHLLHSTSNSSTSVPPVCTSVIVYETLLAAEYEHFTGHVKYKYKIRERWEGHEKSAKNLRKCQERQ